MRLSQQITTMRVQATCMLDDNATFYVGVTTLSSRFFFKIQPLTLKCVQGCVPHYLSNLLLKQANRRILISNTNNLLHIPHTNLKRFGDRAFCVYAPCLELPENHHGLSFPKTLRLLIVCKTSRHSIKHCYFERSLFDYCTLP